MLDDEGTDDPAGIHRLSPPVRGKLLLVDFDHPIPGQQRAQLNPSITRIQFELAKIRKFLKLGFGTEKYN